MQDLESSMISKEVDHVQQPALQLAIDDKLKQWRKIAANKNFAVAMGPVLLRCGK